MDKPAPTNKNMDYTAFFQAARAARGLEPLPAGWRVELMYEGRRLSCGCDVINANGTAYTVRHRKEVCKENWIRWQNGELERKYHVEEDGHIAADTDFDSKVIITCDPLAGLYPHEVA